MYSSVYIYTYMIVCNYIYIFVYVYIYIVICLSFICMDVFHRNQTNNSIYVHLYTHYKHVFQNCLLKQLQQSPVLLISILYIYMYRHICIYTCILIEYVSTVSTSTIYICIYIYIYS